MGLAWRSPMHKNKFIISATMQERCHIRMEGLFADIKENGNFQRFKY